MGRTLDRKCQGSKSSLFDSYNQPLPILYHLDLCWPSVCGVILLPTLGIQGSTRPYDSWDTASQPISLVQREHMFLSQMTRKLDDILWGYIGASMIMCTFDMCFVIFTLCDSHSTLVTVESVALLWMALTTMAAIVLFSISINTWVSIDTLLHGPNNAWC